MQTIINEFLCCFRSSHTKLAYQNDLTQFLNFCTAKLDKQITHPTQISETLCIMWQHHLLVPAAKSVEGMSNQTLARKLAAISSFFKFCQRKKIVTNNPIEFLVRPKTSKIGKTNILTKEEWLHVFNCMEKHIEYARIRGNQTQYRLWKKRYAILYTLFTVGMRVEELCQLKYEDLEKIETDLYRLHLIAKGNEKHSPLIHKKTALVLLDYMDVFSIQRGAFIFEKIHRSNVYHIVKLCVKKAGIIKKVSPHSLRASLATHLHQQGVPLGHIKDLLNHKNIATTILYTRISDDELKENAQLLTEL